MIPGAAREPEEDRRMTERQQAEQTMFKKPAAGLAPWSPSLQALSQEIQKCEQKCLSGS
jgi:hypothetical protein